MKKKITILFSSAHLSYSPTVLGLYDLLAKHFDVAILAQNPEAYSNKSLTGKNIVFRRGLHNKHLLEICRRFYDLRTRFDEQIAILRRKDFPIDVVYDFAQIRKHFAEYKPDFVVAVDFKSLFFAQMLGAKAEFLSLEIVENDVYYDNCDFKNINSVLIQTADRYQYLFGEQHFKTFYIQNAPNYREYANDSARRDLVYCGTAWNPFGFYHCLDFLREYPEYKLHVKGALAEEDRLNIKADYKDLLADERLLIDDEYLDDGEVVAYLRQFRIGFCFYNFEVEWVNAFNYYTAPSGKMFKYMAAGVPVIAQKIPGMRPIEEFDGGVTIENLEPQTIRKAVEKIENDYEYYSRNCLRAAKFYSFDKNAEPFINYLLETNDQTLNK